MKKKLFSIAVAIVVTLFFSGCGDDGLSTNDVNKLINGSNSIKGTIAGTMADNTAYSFAYDYHVTKNDRRSYSESWVEADGTQILYVDQYFYADEFGPSNYGDEWSTSGRGFYFFIYINAKTMTLMPKTYSNYYIEGEWQKTTASGNRFVYGVDVWTGDNSGTIDITGLAYSAKNQMLTGKLNVALPDNHINNLWFNGSNNTAVTITGNFALKVPKEAFEITSNTGNGGVVYRKGR